MPCIKKTKSKSFCRSIENFSTGRRGALMTEYFLTAGFAVVLLAREGSILPFSRDMPGLGDMLDGGEGAARREGGIDLTVLQRPAWAG